MRILAVLMACLGGPAAVHAEPWLQPGDAGVRADIELLADAGIIRGPVTTWPISWPDIARDVLGSPAHGLDASTAAALLRVQRLARRAATMGFYGLGLRASGSYEPTTFRSFAYTPREEGELEARASWLFDHLVVNLQAQAVVDPDDQRRFRADGSYIGVNVGNFVLSAGLLERWWGPGWEGSLILSTNARPIPTVTLERNYTDPFRTPLLSWIGPWRASIAIGEAEAHDVAIPNVRFLAARVNFKPRPWMEFGLSRTAQWCGGDRACGWSTFTDMLMGRDNQVENGSTETQPGNQLAGYDLRLRSPWRRLPLTVYSQWIGEDEAGGLPAKFIGQFGVESWADTGFGGLRVRAEFSDTACNFSRESPEFDCAYRNVNYPQGYRYRGRVIGHSIDGDARMYSIAGLLSLPAGERFDLTLRRIQIDRDGDANYAVPATVEDVELRYSRSLGTGSLIGSLGYQSAGAPTGLGSDLRGFVSWQQGF